MPPTCGGSGPVKSSTSATAQARWRIASIEEVGKARLTARVLKRWTVEPAAPTVTVVQAIPKSDRSELAIELATEAGADAFVAWQAARCVARWDGGRADKGMRRWRAVARAAARQSRRPHIPSVTGVVDHRRVAGRRARGGFPRARRCWHCTSLLPSH